MFARTFTSRARRRGVVLIVVLGMLGLLAIIGFTFATFSNQAQIGARLFRDAAYFPDSTEMMDYALSQLIDDSYNPQSVIRGHSLKRDMYGNDATTNGFVPASVGVAFTSVAAGTGTFAGYVQCRTNISLSDPRFYQQDFTRWLVKFSGIQVPASSGIKLGEGAAVDFFLSGESFEIIKDDRTSGSGFRDFYLVPPYANPANFTRIKGYNSPGSTIQRSVLPSQIPTPVEPSGLVYGIPTGRAMVIDGRFLNAFNGAGISALGNDGGTANLLARNKAEYGNFRFNKNILLGTGYFPGLGDPDTVGMDEDYDACDLENWFLAIQSADGQIMIPSFHRPGILSANPTSAITLASDNDWRRTFPPAGTADQQLKGIRAMSRILRPRQVDGHSSVSFPDLMPDSNGKITYDVDNDGDGTTDSVWLDLGYPAKRNPEGQLFKPLFSFMVIGLNGKLPLNTAGNLNDRDVNSYPTFNHADHLGNSPSEIDLRFALQNSFDNSNIPSSLSYNPLLPDSSQFYSQFDDGNPDMTTVGNVGNIPYTPSAAPTVALKMGTSVAVTQLRNLLIGTRDYDSSPSGGAVTNGDLNVVLINGQPKNFPNGLGDAQDTFQVDPTSIAPAPYNNVVQRLTPPVAGRWGEEDAIPGIIPNTYPPIGGVPSGLSYPIQTVLGPPVIPAHYALNNNFIRSGHSIILSDPSLQSGGDPNTYDGRDDNSNAYDWFPTPANKVGATIPTNFPELQDLYDLAGGLILPSERVRRFVTPIDTSGDGQILTFSHNARGGGRNGRPKNDGADAFGRVSFFHYFRPPGVPIDIQTVHTPGVDDVVGTFAVNATTTPFTFTQQLPVWPDKSNNQYHGFTSFLSPFVPVGVNNQGVTPPQFGIFYAAMPFDDGFTGNYVHELKNAVTVFPTFSSVINSKGVPLQTAATANPAWALNNPSSYGMNEADEVNLYTPSRFDSPFGPTDLEWLYRSQDVDGASLSSRLSHLAPVSFVWAKDATRRRRLFALDSWDLNTYSYANDNPGGINAPGPFSRNSTYRSAPLASASLKAQSVPTPSVAHGGRRINLNFPLPVSNSPMEPVRQKWIRETYTFLKQVLPPASIDTPEELAQLSQYVVNLIDFRDPDCAMTKFVNTDVAVVPPTAPTGALPGGTQTTLKRWTGAVATAYDVTIPPSNNLSNYLIQYGMENPPVALNEVLAFNYYSGATEVDDTTTLNATNYKPVLYFEMVNMLTKDAVNNTPDTSDLDLTGWDVVIMPDNALGRPDLVTGQIPLQPPTATPQVNPVYLNNVLASVGPPGGANPPIPALAAAAQVTLPNTFSNEGNNYYYVFGTSIPKNSGNGNIQSLMTQGTGATAPVYYPPQTSVNPLDKLATQLASADYPPNQYYWLYLRRPPNPFDTTYNTSNPNDNRVVVDSFRFYYTKANGTAYTVTTPSRVDTQIQAPTPGLVYSLERMQPFRGGHGVTPLPNLYTGIPPFSTFALTPYGYSEQATKSTGTAKAFVGQYYTVTKVTGLGVPTTNSIPNTLGANNSPEVDNAWDYLPFNDRDFTSVMELLMVPGTSPGLFTKQFCEQPPPIAGRLPVPAANAPNATWTTTAVPAFTGNGVPHSNPYLIDEFFYTSTNEPTNAAPWPHVAATPTTLASLVDQTSATTPKAAYPFYQSFSLGTKVNSVGGPSGAGWFKMLEFFDVPSMANGAIGPVQQGYNYDWMRQDLRAGQLNLNLIVDEEVFLGLMGTSFYGQIFNPNLGVMNSVQLAAGQTPAIVNLVDDNGAPIPYKFVAGVPFYPNMSNVGIVDTYQDPISGNLITNNLMKSCFSDFLKIRHGGSGFMVGWGSGGVGLNGSVVNTITTPLASERPFRSLSYPDINATIMRPAALPPEPLARVFVNTTTKAVNYTTPGLYADTSVTPYAPINYADFVHSLFPAYPLPGADPQLGNIPALAPGSTSTNPPFWVYMQDPGIKNPYLFTRSEPVQPAPIPPRRLFQVPDFWGYQPAPAPAHNQPPSNASSALNFDGQAPPAKIATGDPAVNNQITSGASLANQTFDLTASQIIGGTPSNVYLGGSGTATVADQRDHPYFRNEWLQKVSNLTTVRTHQFAVWITVGFFEVTKQGNPALAASTGNYVAAYDTFGLELGKLAGNNKRYRSFFLLDRTKATGFNPTSPGDFRDVVTYRQLIE